MALGGPPDAAVSFGRRVRSVAGRSLRGLPAGRRLRIQLAVEAIEAYAAGRALRVLDAGSEEGLLCLELARRHPDWQLVAADLSAAPLRRGHDWARQEDLQVAFVRVDLTRALVANSCDVVVSLESIVEIPDDDAALHTMVGVLRPGGLFVLQVPTQDWTPVLPWSERTWRREARHGYDPGELCGRLAGLGLNVQEVRPTFRRTTALAEDVRNIVKRRARVIQLLFLPAMAFAVRLERRGLTWGSPRATFFLAVKPSAPP